MILCLTYHRVLRQPHTKPKVHDVPVDRFERQVERLTRSGMYPLNPEELLDWKPRSEPSFLLTFDDGTEDHFDGVLPILSRHKLRGIFFVPTAELNRPGFLTDDRVKEMSRAGQYIGLHSHEHRPMTRMTEVDSRHQMQTSHSILERLTGMPPRIFAPPGGYISGPLRASAIDCGVRVIRTMHWGYNQRVDLLNLQCVPTHRGVTDKEFERLLQFRGFGWKYGAKETLKSMLPERIYNAIRNRLFSGAGKRG